MPRTTSSACRPRSCASARSNGRSRAARAPAASPGSSCRKSRANWGRGWTDMSDSEDVLFSPSVKAEQTRLGSRKMFEGREWQSEITPDLRQFLDAIDTFFFATASADGRPYIQHRGGPPGFLKPIGPNELAFADFAGNRQYITLGHLKENDRAHIFILHFATQQRVKLWGRARVVEGDLELMERLVDSSYKAKPQRAIVFTLEAWDSNCPQHIVPRYTEAEIAPAVDKLIVRIKELEEEVAALRAGGAPGGV